MTRTIFDDFENNRDYTIERLDKISSAISLFTVSSEISFQHFNLAADKMFGYESGGLLAATADDPLKILHPENEDQFYGEIIATMRDGRFFNYNCRILCSDGSYKWTNISAELVRQSGGTLYYHGVLTPIDAPSNIQLKGLHTLLIADGGPELDKLINIIESKGGTCNVINYGMDGFDKFEASEPGYYHCIFIGSRMKDVNGMELVKEIRFSSHAQAADIPVVLLVDGLDADPEMLHEMGINATLTKPFEDAHITDILLPLVPEE